MTARDNDFSQTVQLGSVSVPALGVGTWQWGDSFFWGASQFESSKLAHEAYLEARTAGLRFFDTAEFYANGLSEQLLGRFIREQRDRSDVFVATKFWTPYQLSVRALPNALQRSLDRTGLKVIDLYQIHWPVPWMRIETLMDAMAELLHAGKVRMIGVSNFNARQLRIAMRQLERNGLRLTSNQVEYNLITRTPETNDVLQICRDHNVVLLAHSPLAQGLLTGKYHALDDFPRLRPRGIRRYSPSFHPNKLAQTEPLVRVLTEIGKVRDKSAAQIALNWLVMNGVMPIPGARDAEQAAHNAKALGWQLERAEFEWIDHVSAGHIKL